MAEFLAGPALSDAIKRILRGNNVRCAVAFWGKDAETFLNKNGLNHARIICNISLGSTNPKTLIALGAPKNRNIKYITNIHSKVYISDVGAVVGSANASSNGIGFHKYPELIESGILLNRGDDALTATEDWFEDQWKSSKPVDAAALNLAKMTFIPPIPVKRSPAQDSLIDLILTHPNAFADISIVLCNIDTTQEQRDEVRADAMRANINDDQDIKESPDEGTFYGWGTSDINRWRPLFVEFWMPKNRLYVSGRRVTAYDASSNSIISQESWTSIRAHSKLQLPTIKEICKADRKIVRDLIEKNGCKLYNIYDLRSDIEDLK